MLGKAFLDAYVGYLRSYQGHMWGKPDGGSGLGKRLGFEIPLMDRFRFDLSRWVVLGCSLDPQARKREAEAGIAHSAPQCPQNGLVHDFGPAKGLILGHTQTRVLRSFHTQPPAELQFRAF